jgi:cytochrome c553
MNRNKRLASVLILLLFALQVSPLPARIVADEPLSAVAANMHEHLARISTIKSAVIAGKLQDVRGPANWLAEHETVPGLPGNFAPYVASMRQYARELATTEDLRSAAQAVSNMAKTCGNCHQANKVNLQFGYDQLPREDIEDVVTHMQRHQWATDRMWDGLIGPSDSAWNRGVDMLIDVPLLPSDVTTESERFSEIGDIAGRIHALASMAVEAKSLDSRSELYGEVLGLCAQCHTLLGRGPSD